MNIKLIGRFPPQCKRLDSRKLRIQMKKTSSLCSRTYLALPIYKEVAVYQQSFFTARLDGNG